jgi:hypothetical protein
MQAFDLTGQVFGRLTVISLAYNHNGRWKWFCRCQCGNEIEVISAKLNNGHTRSCGCLKDDMTRLRSGSNHYKWNQRINHRLQRCNNREQIAWRNSVLQRDGWTCDITGIVGGVLQAHHLNAWAWFPRQRFLFSNGITLSIREHRLFHAWMGGIDVKCTKADYERYKPMRLRELLTVGI